jgi:hypothetical protein
MNCVFPYSNVKWIQRNNFRNALRNNLFNLDALKVGFLLSLCAGSLLIYIITVNISSTKWYYYDQARREQEKVNFSHNIVKLNTLNLQSNLRGSINFNSSLKKDSVQYLEIIQ